MNRFPEPIDHCYILCDPVREPDRANYLRTWFASNNIDPTCWTMCMDCYGTDPVFQTRDVWTIYDPWTTKYKRQIQNHTSRNLKAAEISLILNFAGAARRAVEAGHKVVMILESDVLFCEDFLQKFKDVIQKLPPKWDFLSLSASAKLFPNRTEADRDRVWFPPTVPYFHTRCTDSMVFNVDMLRRILTTLFPCAEPLDWELNFQLTLHFGESFWLDPPLLKQGSQDGTYDTLL